LDNSEIYNLINRAKRGDKIAFRSIVDEHSAFVYSVAFKIVANEEDTCDMVQETFIKLWKNLKKYDPKVKFTTWLYKIVTNLCLDHLKSKKRKMANAHLDVNNISNILKHDGAENEMILKDMVKVIKSLTQQLTPIQKIVFVLYFLEEKDIDEINSITGYKKGNIKSNIYYARKNMLEMLEKTTGMKNLTIES